MPHRTPDAITVVLGAAISVLGGIARWYENGLFGKKFHFAIFLADMCLSAVAGVLVYWLAFDLGQPGSVCAIGAAVTGNIGSRVFGIAKQIFSQRTGIDMEAKDEDRSLRHL